jgi:hypothetical protein
MADRDFKVGIEMDASSAVAATKAVTDETERYEAALRKMAIAAKSAEQAQRNLEAYQAAEAKALAKAADDNERYQASLQKMAIEQAERTGKHGRPDDGWFAGVQERRAVMVGALKDQGEAGKAAMEEIRAATDKTTGSTKHLKEALSRLAMDYPQLAAIGRNSLTGTGAALTALGLGFALVRKEIEDFNATLQEVPWDGFTKGASGASEEVRQVRDLAKEAAEHSERLADVFNARQSAEERMDAARKRLELSQARAIADPTERAAAELEIENRYALRGAQREQRARDFKLQEQERRAAELLEKRNKLGSSLNELMAMQGAVGKPEDLEKWLKYQEERLNGKDGKGGERGALVAIEEKIAELQSKLESLPADADSDPITRVRRAAAMTELEQLQSNRESQAAVVNQLQFGQRGIRETRQRLEDARLLQSRIGLLQPAYENVNQSYNGIQGMLPTQRAVAGIEGQAAREALSAETRERMTRAGADAQQNTEKLVRSLVDAIEGEKGNQASILAELQRWKDWQGTIEKQIEGLRNR